jgi:hypothetical protein
MVFVEILLPPNLKIPNFPIVLLSPAVSQWGIEDSVDLTLSLIPLFDFELPPPLFKVSP